MTHPSPPPHPLLPQLPDTDHPDPQVPPRPGPLQRLWPALLSGLSGALALTLLNEGVRQVLPGAPRLDVLGERALSAGLRAAGVRPPRGAALYRWTMAADLASNTLYYTVIGLVRPAGPPAAGVRPRGRVLVWRRGCLLGLAAGLGAVLLPRPVGLGRQPGSRGLRTPLLTVTWYLTGGLVTAAVDGRLSRAPGNPGDRDRRQDGATVDLGQRAVQR